MRRHPAPTCAWTSSNQRYVKDLNQRFGAAAGIRTQYYRRLKRSSAELKCASSPVENLGHYAVFGGCFHSWSQQENPFLESQLSYANPPGCDRVGVAGPEDQEFQYASVADPKAQNWQEHSTILNMMLGEAGRSMFITKSV
jgi:hypothetical protein